MPGDQIKEHMKDQDVGDIDCWHGKLDEVPFHLHCMKKPDYIISLMTTYGTEERMGIEKSRTYKDSL